MKAWQDICPHPIQGRKQKPRETGLTVIIDKGMGLQETEDLLRLSADYIDFIKLAFGTSALYEEKLLREKIRLIQDFGIEVYPGGTFLEVAAVQGRVGEFMLHAKRLGFHVLEVSDGTIPMSADFRRELIQHAHDLGFLVISEVGKKHPADRVPGSNIRQQIEADLDSGVYKVIIEGRESGKGVVIFQEDGSIDEDELELLVERLPDPDVLIWEAPLKEQQQDLLVRFGPNVNLGNIPPHEIIALEALRVGLRGDTLRTALLTHPERFRPPLSLDLSDSKPGDENLNH